MSRGVGDASNDGPEAVDSDPLDEAAAEIDPRSPEAPDQVAALEETAEALGRDVEDD